MFEIDKGVPVPSMNSEGTRRRVYPFVEMEVGDSFFVPLDGRNRRFLQQQLVSAWGWVRRQRGYRFTSKAEADGVRVWRTA